MNPHDVMQSAHRFAANHVRDLGGRYSEWLRQGLKYWWSEYRKILPVNQDLFRVMAEARKATNRASFALLDGAGTAEGLESARIAEDEAAMKWETSVFGCIRHAPQSVKYGRVFG